MTVTRGDVVTLARTWIGVPYLHQGRSRLGVDCVGLIIVVARQLGLTDYDISGYPRVPSGDFLRAECDRMMARISIASARPGDVLLLRFRREPQHLALMTERGMLHAYAGSTRVTEGSIPTEWAERIVAAYSLPGVA